MKTFKIESNGSFALSLSDLDRAAVYLVGELGPDAVVELCCYGSVFHTMEATYPVIISMGRGAPLEIIISNATEFTDARLVAHEVR